MPVRHDDVTPLHQVSRAVAISRYRRTEPRQNSGESSHGDRRKNKTRASGRHDGGSADTRISDVVRPGNRAAKAAAMRPPYDTPQIAALSIPAWVVTDAWRSHLVTSIRMQCNCGTIGVRDRAKRIFRRL